MLLPKRLYFSGDFWGDFYACLAFGPDDLRDGINEDIGRENLVGSGIDYGFPAHVHVVGFSALAGPVFVYIRVGSEGTYPDDSSGFLIADADEYEAVAFVGLFVLYDAPVEEIRGTVPVVGICENVFPGRKVEIIKEALQLVARKEGIPVKEECCHDYWC